MDLPESVCDTFKELKDPTREEPMHNIFMDKVNEDTNQGTPSQGDSFAFPFFGNVGVPLMATLNIPGLNVGLLVWLGTIKDVPNDFESSQLRTLIHGNPVDVSSSAKDSTPPSPASGESTVTSNHKFKRIRKRKIRNKKSPTSVSHLGDRSTTPASHIEYQHPNSASHVGGTQPPSTSHVRGGILVTASHTGNRSVASASNVIDPSPTSSIHVRDVKPVTASHTDNRSIASTSHVIEPSPTYASHVGDVKPTTTSQDGGIVSVEKHRWIGNNPKFPCNLCKGDHPTHLCPGI
jgi:hypothetical protein